MKRFSSCNFTLFSIESIIRKVRYKGPADNMHLIILTNLYSQQSRTFDRRTTAFLESKRNVHAYLQTLLDREMKKEGFKHSRLSRAAQALWSLLQDRKAITIRDVKAAGIVKQTSQLQRLLVDLEEELGIVIEKVSDRKPHIYFHGCSKGDALVITGKKLRLTGRQVNILELFETNYKERMIKEREFRIDKTSNLYWVNEMIKDIRKNIKIFKDYSDLQIKEAVAHDGGLFRLIGDDEHGNDLKRSDKDARKNPAGPGRI